MGLVDGSRGCKVCAIGFEVIAQSPVVPSLVSLSCTCSAFGFRLPHKFC